MAITSPGVTLAIDALFGCVKPQLDIIQETNVAKQRNVSKRIMRLATMYKTKAAGQPPASGPA